MRPATLMLIRHAEKPSGDGSVMGVDLQGSTDEHELSVRGWQRAGALVGLFAGSTGIERSGIRRPDRLFACGSTREAPSKRSNSTLVPLSQYLSMPISTRRVKGEEDALACEAIMESGVSLVCWEHKRLAALARSIAGPDVALPSTWPEDRFDVVWVFERGDAGRWNFSQVPQMLLAGDRIEPLDDEE